MARYYRRRYRTIVRAPKKKWASNIAALTMSTTGSATNQYATQTLVNNATELASPTPVIVKTGNIRVQGDYRFTTTSAGGVAGVSLYVVFGPQGVSISSDLEAFNIINNHPEWIMAWKYLGANKSSGTSAENSDAFTFSSRLKRNLNSGDSIQLICRAQGSNMSSVTISGMAQYWTCAN